MIDKGLVWPISTVPAFTMALGPAGAWAFMGPFLLPARMQVKHSGKACVPCPNRGPYPYFGHGSQARPRRSLPGALTGAFPNHARHHPGIAAAGQPGDPAIDRRRPPRHAAEY